MKPRIGVSLVGRAAITSRIHERLSAEEFRVRAYAGPKSVLRRSKMIEEFFPIGHHSDPTRREVVEAAEAGVIEPDDWVIWGTDPLLGAMAVSGLTEAEKLALLPTKKAEGLALLGSKVGLARLCEKYNIASPRSVVVTSLAELQTEVASAQGPLMVKGSAGVAGFQVQKIAPGEAAAASAVPLWWYPLVVQEYLDGPLVSVEALFNRGRLMAYIYSSPLHFNAPFGVSSRRHFHAPTKLDFVDTLAAMGDITGLHGFANCSFVFDDETRRHRIFEMDMRPNLWHQFGPDLGVSWARGMKGEAHQVAGPTQPHREAMVRHFTREFHQACTTRSITPILPWLRRDAGTWEWRQSADASVNWQEMRGFLRAALRGSRPSGR